MLKRKISAHLSGDRIDRLGMEDERQAAGAVAPVSAPAVITAF